MALVIPAALLVFLPIDQVAGMVVAAVLFGGCVILLVVGSPVLAVTLVINCMCIHVLHRELPR